MPANLPDFNDVITARERIAPHVHCTDVKTSQYLSSLAGCDLYFKCENLQKTGAFKVRGASNAVFALSDSELSKGVITHSSGNHGMALSYAAAKRDISATVIMPSNALASKKEAVRAYGGHLVECAPTLQARESTMLEEQARSGANFVSPFDDPRVIAGQASCAAELHEQIAGLDILIAPVGGGGLLSGCCISTQALSPDTQVIAAEPAAADDAYQSFKAGKLIKISQPTTIADGLQTNLGDLTWQYIESGVHAIWTVSEEEIVSAMRLLWQRLKLVVEPSSAVVLAAVLKNPEIVKNRRVGLILSGGNVDIDQLPW